MKRFKEYNPDQNYLISFNPNVVFPVGSYEHFIIDIIEKTIQEDEFYPKKTDKGGSEAHNPKAVLGILFYGYSKGIYSYRKMARSCLYDVAFIFISGYTTPDHSTISRFVQNFQGQIIKSFSKILYIAAEEGFIDYEMTATDGTKLIANASDKFSGTLEDFEKRKANLEKKIQEALEKSEKATDEDTKNYWDNKRERQGNLMNKIEDFLKEAEEITKKDGKEVKQNITDNDARTMRIEGKGYKPGYNAQATVCAKNGIIVGADVTNQANDVQQLQPMLELTEELTPEELKENLKNGKHLADNGYDSVDNAIYADKKNLDIYIPAGTTKELYSKETEESEIETIGIKNCKIEKNGTETKITCPGGIILTQYTKTKIKDEIYCHFTVHDNDKCKSCNFYAKCYGKIKEGKKKAFRIKADLLDNWELIQENRAKIESEKGKIIYSKRMGAIEKVFGHIKANMGCRQLLVRGIDKVKAVWSMYCTVYNMLRIFCLQFQQDNKGARRISWELLSSC